MSTIGRERKLQAGAGSAVAGSSGNSTTIAAFNAALPIHSMRKADRMRIADAQQRRAKFHALYHRCRIADPVAAGFVLADNMGGLIHV